MRQVALKLVGAVVVLALVVGFAGAALAQEEAAPVVKAPPAETIYQKAQTLGLTKYCELAQAAGLVDVLNQEGRMTVFAPTNEALVALGEEKLAALVADPAAARQFILAQVIPDRQSLLMALPKNSPPAPRSSPPPKSTKPTTARPRPA
jgi:uncharacterized surface protein with fasciclin (FAS1) repeats